MKKQISRDLFIARAEQLEWTRVAPSFMKNLPAMLGQAYGVRVYRVTQDKPLFVMWQHPMNHSDVLAYQTDCEFWEELERVLDPAPQMSEEEYTQTGGLCPYCNCDSVEAGHIEVTWRGATQKVWCLVCGSEWVDEYKLVGYTPIS